jgi:hypothetical protein
MSHFIRTVLPEANTILGDTNGLKEEVSTCHKVGKGLIINNLVGDSIPQSEISYNGSLIG